MRRIVSYSVHNVSAWRIKRWSQLEHVERQTVEGHVSQFTERMIDECSIVQRSIIFLVLLLVPGWFSGKKISSPTCSIISGIWTDLRRPPLGFLVRADPVSFFIDVFTDKLNSVQLQVLLSVLFAVIARSLSPCLRSVWILIYRPRNFTHDSSNQLTSGYT